MDIRTNYRHISFVRAPANSINNFSVLWSLSYSSNWAIKGTLATFDTGSIAQDLSAGRSYCLSVPSLDNFEEILARIRFACTNASAAEDTFQGVDLNRVR
jgi:hypothetical protein